MALKPHCVVCGYYSDSDVAGTVRFANYSETWTYPVSPSGSPELGWANELGVTAPPGVGEFCERHLAQAEQLRHLDSEEAVSRIR
ncbi:MAG TPA: hypothetical protein VME19_19375 [Streptosporangiaceae bacterium]|jgi:hypothetical protein|nr:hypothetical protein [Streptosporangiaceae bacterium]